MYKVFDLETQTHTHHKRKASPWCGDNYIVALGWKNQGADVQTTYNVGRVNQNLYIEDNCTLLVGFNIKFDLLWQWNNPMLQDFLKRGGKIWDCQYAEYLLSGQTITYPDLNSTAPKYTGTKKVDAIKALWDAGVQTSDIDKDLLVSYLEGDVLNTELVFLGQVKEAQRLGMITALMSRMDGLLSTTEMEYNGIYVDTKEASKQYKEIKQEFDELYQKLNTYIPDLPEGLEFNWGSIVHRSCLVFGGSVKYTVKGRYKTDDGNWARKQETEKHYLMQDGTTCKAPKFMHEVQKFKSGKNAGEYKTKLVKIEGEYKEKLLEKVFVFKGYAEPREEWATALTDANNKPVYQTTAEVLQVLGASTEIEFCKDLSKYMKLKKELTTYFFSTDNKGNTKGMLTCVDPKTHIIHHSLVHCSTVTTRLSSTNPNMQNIPREGAVGIKKMFSSRFGEDGLMLEADYKQLEIVVQAVLTNDKQLQEDLLNKIDFHCKRVAGQVKYNISYEDLVKIINDENHKDHKYWKSIRTLAKRFSFQRTYGAGSLLIASSTGMTLEDVNTLIELEDAMYPSVVEYNNQVLMDVRTSAVPFRDTSNGYKMYRRGTYKAPTGCIYSFRSYDAPKFVQEKEGVRDTFSPTELKNYPIQGTGGEIVQGLCGKLYRKFLETNNYGGKALLVNTVHDCIWVDLHKDVKEVVARDVKTIMESVPEWFKQFNVTIRVPFPVDVELGRNMGELEHA